MARPAIVRCACALAWLPWLSSAGLTTNSTGALRLDCLPSGPQVPDGWARFVNTSVEIPASTATIWSLLMGVSTWHEWNDVYTATRLEGEPREGTHFLLSSYLRTAPWYLRHSAILMEYFVIHEREKVCWTPQLLLGYHAEHCFVLCPRANGTLVYNYEDHHGFMEPIAQRNLANATADAFRRFNGNLTTAAEHHP